MLGAGTQIEPIGFGSRGIDSNLFMFLANDSTDTGTDFCKYVRL